MKANLQDELLKLSKKKIKKRKYKQLLTLASVVVSLMTFYILMTPAITLTCTKEEHIHNNNCYSIQCDQLSEHEHTSECFGELICPLKEHIHNEVCFDEEKITLLSLTKSSRTDLTEYITEASYEEVKYNSGKEVYETSFHLKFHDITKEEILNANYQFEFDFPEGVYIPQNLLDLEHIAYDGSQPSFIFKFSQVGTSSNGKPLYGVTIDFYPEYVANTFTVIDNEINFKAELDPNLKDDSGNFNVTFTPDVIIQIDNEDITYDGDSTENYDMNVTKQGNYDITHNKLIYTVVVDTKKGTPESIFLKDALTTGSGINIGTPVISSIVKQDSLGNQTNLSSNNYVLTTNGTAYELTINKKLNANEKYIITYEYPVSNVVDGTYANTNNSIQSTAKDPKTNEQIQDETSTNVVIKKDPLKKSGIYDSNSKSIKWTIIVNSDHIDITNYQLKDSMFATAHDLTIISDGTQDGYAIIKNNNTITGIQFNAVKDGKNTQQYTITYTTPVNDSELSWNDTIIKNNATFSKWGNNVSTESSEVKVNGGNVSKLKGKIEENNGIQTIPFTSTISIPSGGIPSGTIIQDKLTGSNHYMTKQQMIDLYNSIQSSLWKNKIKSFQVTIDGNNWIDYSNAIQNSEYTKFKGFKFVTSQVLYQSDGMNKQIVLNYNSTIDGQDNYGKHSFSNSIQVGDKQDTVTWQDSFTNVQKTDGNDKADSSVVTSKDGIITWKVKVSLSENIDELEIIDTLPQGITLVEVKYGHPYDLLSTNINNDGTITAINSSDSWWSNNIDISGSKYSDSSNEVILKAKVKDSNQTHPRAFEEGAEFYVVIKAKIDDAENLEIGESASYPNIKNNVDLIINNKTYSDDQTQSVTVKIPDPDSGDEDTPDISKETLSKGGTWNNDARLLEYSLVINPEEKKLSDGNRIKLIDDLLYNKDTNVNLKIALAQESVKLYYAVQDENGKLVKGEQVPQSQWKWEYVQNSGKNWSNLSNTIEAQIPDQTALILDYSYKVYLDESKVNGSYTPYIYNTATLEGTDKTTDDNGLNAAWKEITTSGSSASNKTFILYKVDSRNYGLTLDGAEFTLYQYNGTEYVQSNQVFVTKDGKLNIHWPEKDSDYKFQYNTAYYIVETKPPPGYTLSDDRTEYYFYFSNNDSSIDLVPDSFTGTDLSISTQIVYCENEKPIVQVKVDKTWQDENGNLIDASKVNPIEVELWRYVISDEKWNEYINKEPLVDLKMQVKATNWGGYWWDEVLSVKENSTLTITLTNQYGANGSANIPELYYNDELITFTKTNSKGTVYEWTGSFIVTEGGTFSGTLNWWSESDWSRSYSIKMAFPSIPEGELIHYKESIAYDTINLNTSNNWQYSWDELPQIGIDESGNLVHYVYEVDEGFVSGFTPAISSTFDKITGNYHYHILNTKNKQEMIILPETGGYGTLRYIASGILLISLSWVGLLYNKRITERRWHSPDS